MCVAYPGKIISIEDKLAKVDFSGNEMDINIGLVRAKVGDFVLVHAGYAMEVLDEEKALKILEIWDSME